jgi:hypothetical protein
LCLKADIAGNKKVVIFSRLVKIIRSGVDNFF